MVVVSTCVNGLCLAPLSRVGVFTMSNSTFLWSSGPLGSVMEFDRVCFSGSTIEHRPANDRKRQLSEFFAAMPDKSRGGQLWPQAHVSCSAGIQEASSWEPLT